MNQEVWGRVLRRECRDCNTVPAQKDGQRMSSWLVRLNGEEEWTQGLSEGLTKISHFRCFSRMLASPSLSPNIIRRWVQTDGHLDRHLDARGDRAFSGS